MRHRMGHDELAQVRHLTPCPRLSIDADDAGWHIWIPVRATAASNESVKFAVQKSEIGYTDGIPSWQ